MRLDVPDHGAVACPVEADRWGGAEGFRPSARDPHLHAAPKIACS